MKRSSPTTSSRHLDGVPALNLAGRTSLRDLIAIFPECAAAFGPDSGPMHIAAAVGCPVVSLWGATAAERSAPWGFAELAISGAIPCHPCYLRKCPIGRECMRRISPEEVGVTVRRALAMPRVGAVAMSWRMTGLDGVRLTRGGWSFLHPGLRRAIFRRAAREPDRFRIRRNRRHAGDSRAPLASRRDVVQSFRSWAGGPQAYFKVLDPIRGHRIASGRYSSAGGRRTSRRFRSICGPTGSESPEILLLGAERRGGREIIVTSRVDGFNLVRHLKRATLASRRVVLACARCGGRAAASRRIHPWRPDAVQCLCHGNRAAAICFHRSRTDAADDSEPLRAAADAQSRSTGASRGHWRYEYGSDARVERVLSAIIRASPAAGTTPRCRDACRPESRSNAETRQSRPAASSSLGRHREASGN